MMKKITALILALMMVLSLVACGGGGSGNENNNTDTANDAALTEDDSSNTEETAENSDEDVAAELSADELEAEIQKQPCFVYECEYYVQDEQYKALYPDLMLAKLENQSGTAIKDVIVAFAAWDENNLPVIIDTIGSDDYVIQCAMNGINLADGSALTNQGMQVESRQAERGEIKLFKAIVVSYEDFDGNTWENPLYMNWVNIYREQVLK